LLIVQIAGLSSVAASLYVPTPAGWMLEKCVHEVPSGSKIVKASANWLNVTSPNGDKHRIPPCDTTRAPLFRTTKSDTHAQGLPPDYDGWLQYTAYNDSRGFDSFTSVMSVPDAPKARPQILYLFPGLQNIDWIPKVDPEPTFGHPFDIIQPVLQYPSGELLSRKWGLKSWYVTVNSGALYSNELLVEPGDEVLCNMTRTGEDSWSVAATVKSTGDTTTQHCTNDRLKMQPWAYTTVECYGCRGCDTYPTKPVTFTDMHLYREGQEVNGTWAVNPKPAEKLMCQEHTSVQDWNDVTIAFDK